MMTLDIALSDWRVASWTENHFTEFIQPLLLRAPKVTLEAAWGLREDIWNTGALVPEVLSAERMFCGKTDSEEYSTRICLEEMVTLFGAVPRALLKQGDPMISLETFDADNNVQAPQLKK